MGAWIPPLIIPGAKAMAQVPPRPLPPPRNLGGESPHKMPGFDQRYVEVTCLSDTSRVYVDGLTGYSTRCAYGPPQSFNARCSYCGRRHDPSVFGNCAGCGAPL